MTSFMIFLSLTLIITLIIFPSLVPVTVEFTLMQLKGKRIVEIEMTKLSKYEKHENPPG